MFRDHEFYLKTHNESNVYCLNFIIFVIMTGNIKKWDKTGLLDELSRLDKIIIADAFEYMMNRHHQELKLDINGQLNILRVTKRILLLDKKTPFDKIYNYMIDKSTNVEYDLFCLTNKQLCDDEELLFVKFLVNNFFDYE